MHGEPANVVAVGSGGPDIAQVGKGDAVLMDMGIADQASFGSGRLEQQREDGQQHGNLGGGRLP